METRVFLIKKVAEGLQYRIKEKNEFLQDNIRSIIGSCIDDKQRFKECQRKIKKLTNKFIEGSEDIRRYPNTLLNEFEIITSDITSNQFILQVCESFVLAKLPSVTDYISIDDTLGFELLSEDMTFIKYIDNYKKSNNFDGSVIEDIEDYIKYTAIAIQIYEFKKEASLYICKTQSPDIEEQDHYTLINSFKLKECKRNPSRLKYFKESLEINGLIDQISITDFRKVFSGEVTDVRICWKGNKGELSYLIKQLHNNLKLVENIQSGHWITAVEYFIPDTKGFFDSKNLRYQKNPKCTNHLDIALSNLKC